MTAQLCSESVELTKIRINAVFIDGSGVSWRRLGAHKNGLIDAQRCGGGELATFFPGARVVPIDNADRQLVSQAERELGKLHEMFVRLQQRTLLVESSAALLGIAADIARQIMALRRNIYEQYRM